MYEEILNIIYNYAFNYKLPDVKFIDSVLDIIVDKELGEYITRVEHNYQSFALASYLYENKILRFNLDMILIQYSNFYQVHKRMYGMDDFNKYLYICLSVLEIIFHELEHVIQSKKTNTLLVDDFERQLIEISTIAVEVYPDLYDKRHDLFFIEREANIKSCKKIKEVLALCESSSRGIKSNFNKRYNQLVNKYYSYDNYPLLTFLNITHGKLSYYDFPIEKYNTERILASTKENLSFEDRVLMGLPLDKKEYHRLRRLK